MNTKPQKQENSFQETLVSLVEFGKKHHNTLEYRRLKKGVLMNKKYSNSEFKRLLDSLLKLCTNNNNTLKLSFIDIVFGDTLLSDMQINQLYSALIENDIEIIPFETRTNHK